MVPAGESTHNYEKEAKPKQLYEKQMEEQNHDKQANERLAKPTNAPQKRWRVWVRRHKNITKLGVVRLMDHLLHPSANSPQEHVWRCSKTTRKPIPHRT